MKRTSFLAVLCWLLVIVPHVTDAADISEIPAGFQFTQFLQKGSRGTEVRYLQILLQNIQGIGIDVVGNADGIFGNKTDAAVRMYQQLRGLGVDGKVGPITRSALNADLAKLRVSIPDPPSLRSPDNWSVINTTTPTFQWYQAAGAEHYGLNVKDEASGILVFDSDVDYGPIYGTSFTIRAGILQPGHQYRWNMRARNSAGQSDFSSLWYFTIQEPETRIIRLEGDLNFGDVQVNSSAQRSLKIYNDGNATLTVHGISYPNGFSGSWSGSIAAGNYKSITVTFFPTQAISYSGVVNINSDRTSGTSTKSISGTGKSTRYTLVTAVNPPGSGQVAPDGGSYDAGTSVTVVASANPGYVFSHWSGDASGSSESISITMDTPKNITANFTEEQTVPTTTVGVIPPQSHVALGSSASVEIQIQDVSNFGGIEFTLRFNPGIVQIAEDDVQAGSFLAGYSVFPLGPQFKDTGGVTEMSYGVSLLGSGGGPSGTGSLVDLSITGVGAGSTDLELLDVKVIDATPQIAEIALAEVISGTVVVEATDTVPPTIIDRAPEPDAVSIPIDTDIQVTFSEPMNQDAVESSFSIAPTVDGTFGWTDNTLTFTPTTDLEESVLYVVSISDQAVDLADNALTPASWSFMTAGPSFYTDPSALSFGEDESSKQLLVYGAGMAWGLGASPGWVSTFVEDGAAEVKKVNVSIDRTGLSPGIYAGKITIKSSIGDQLVVQITVHVGGVAYGDVSMDGTINAYDASLVLQYLVGLEPLSSEKRMAGDVTGNGRLSALDASLILQYVVGLITRFPVEDVPTAPSIHIQTEDELLAQSIRELERVTLNSEQRRVLELLRLMLAERMPPSKTMLLANYPNPFNPETWIPYQLANDTDVSIKIFDANGRLVRRLELGQRKAGYHRTRTKAAHWDGRNDRGERVASGMYFYQMVTSDFQQTRRLIITK